MKKVDSEISTVRRISRNKRIPSGFAALLFGRGSQTNIIHLISWSQWEKEWSSDGAKQGERILPRTAKRNIPPRLVFQWTMWERNRGWGYGFGRRRSYRRTFQQNEGQWRTQKCSHRIPRLNAGSQFFVRAGKTPMSLLLDPSLNICTELHSTSPSFNRRGWSEISLAIRPRVTTNDQSTQWKTPGNTEPCYRLYPTIASGDSTNRKPII